MKDCWYCKTNGFIIHEYEGLLRLGICKNCERITIETLDGSGNPYQTYSKCSVNNISEEIISKWNDYNHFKLVLVQNKRTGESKLDIYYPYEGRLQCDRIETLAFGNGLGVEKEQLIHKNIEIKNNIIKRVEQHDNSLLVKLWRCIFRPTEIPKYHTYE